MTNLLARKIANMAEELTHLFAAPHFDESYRIIVSSNGIQYVQMTPAKRQIFSESINSKLEICSIARKMYEHVRSREHDHVEFVAIARLWNELDHAQKTGKIQSSFSEVLGLACRFGYGVITLEKLVNATPEEVEALKNNVVSLLDNKVPAETTVCVKGIKLLAQTARGFGIGFLYERDSYYSELIETYSFIPELKRLACLFS